jgi:parvulin-like peptidyl-prolyl isomerase
MALFGIPLVMKEDDYMGLKEIGQLAALLFLLACTACGPALATSAPSSAPLPLDTATAPPAVAPAATDASTPDASAPPTPDALVAVLVNGQPIYLTDYERKLGQYEASLPAQGIDPNSAEGQEKLAWARSYVLDMMIGQMLTEQAATAAGIVVSDEEVDAYMQVMIAENGGEEAFKAKLAEWGETYEDAWWEVRAELIGMAMTQRIIESVPSVTEHVHTRHILVDTPEEAERIHAQLQAGADFAALAREYSQDPNTRETGGDLGFFPRGILTAPEVEEVAFALQPGQFSEVVASVLGYHIVQVVERDPARQVGPENLHLLQERVLGEWVEGMWAQAVVQRFVETSP